MKINFNPLTIVIVACDAHSITNEVIRSIFKYVKLFNFKIILFDNSKKTKFALENDLINYKNIEIQNNFNNQIISFEPEKLNFKLNTPTKIHRGFGSAEHSKIIQYFINTLENFLLLDADAILINDLDFLKDLEDDIISCSDLTFVAERSGVQHKPRCIPFIQYFNCKLIRNYNLKYFDISRLYGFKQTTGLYDTGAAFYEDIINHNLINKFKLINYTDYICHCKGASLDGNIFDFDIKHLKSKYLLTYRICFNSENYHINYAINMIESIKKQNILANKNIICYITSEKYNKLPDIQKKYLSTSKVICINNIDGFNKLTNLPLSYKWENTYTQCDSNFLFNKINKINTPSNINNTSLINTTNFCIYTCITGHYDTLPQITNPEITHFVFTDDKDLKTPDGWIKMEIPPEFNKYNNVKKQRMVKCLPHKVLPIQYKYSLWIDASHILKPNIFNNLLTKLDLTTNYIYRKKHPHRNCIYAECDSVVKAKKDTSDIPKKLKIRYKGEGLPENFGLTETGFLFRQHLNPNIIKFNIQWANEISENSHRDQLSFDYIIWKNPNIKIGVLNDLVNDLNKTDNSIFKINKHKKY